jgi:uncharacterized protein (DUF736 family)
MTQVKKTKEKSDVSESANVTESSVEHAEVDEFLGTSPTKRQGTRTINLGGLWLNTSKGGAVYLAGSLGRCKILIFKNPNKENEDHPDYNIVLAERESKPKVVEGDPILGDQ